MAPFATLHTTTHLLHARVTKALAAANLNGLEIAIASNFIYPATTKTAKYLSKFPMGKIPALETPSGFYLSEGSAIAHYIADSGPKREQLLGRTAEERALIQMWIGLSDSEIFPSGSAVIGPSLGRAPYEKSYVESKEAEFTRAIKRLELHLSKEGRVWLVRDDEFSLADLSVAASLYWPFKFLLDPEARERFPCTTEWYERLIAQDGVTDAFGGKLQLCEKRGPAFPEGGEVREP